jgi:hydrogenase maturation protease
LKSNVTLIGVGNPWRSDDGVGWAVAAAARRRLSEDVAVIETDGEPSRLIDAWTDTGLAVVVDAMSSGADPGTIRIRRGDAEFVQSRNSSASHSLGVAEAIALGRAVQRLPQDLVVVGIEVQETSHGNGLSAAVSAAVERAAEVIGDLVTAWQQAVLCQAGSNATSSAAPGSSE